ncbi:MAG: hypothetical protein A2934_01785 [Candidatus Sungbacteria bacterium RIFCSPLOWO2_01_FULL_47_10]|uniref:Uncharacterized protein n=1 Tax=Candidatus Sungbacteria bacterium RIFCSPLOWO2_01_FULL_47_10 TaxID=1802276 RepID=A0A1G2L1T7_9BACT|nr:MAG: hypothetical protein A2934_01785 [Candidatus Sungbacteria bacterium RIFCSPLOWO2_01_FULL_47_10]
MAYFTEKFFYGIFTFIVFLGIVLTAINVRAIQLPQGGVQFDTLKQTTLTVVDAALKKLNAAEALVQSNPNISDEVKTDVITLFNDVENALLGYKADVEQTTTLEELKAVNQEIVAYLSANKDVFKESFKKIKADIAQNAKIKAEEFKQKVEQIIVILKVTCPQEKDAIAEVEQQLSELQTHITALNAAIHAKDTVAMKKEMLAIETLMKAMIANMKQIEESCL